MSKTFIDTIRQKPFLILITLVFFFTYLYLNYAVSKHLAFETHAFDLGIYTQISWLYSENITPFSTLKHMPLLADHFEPILWVLAPFYRLFPDPLFLLALQAIFVSGSSIPLFLIALKKTKSLSLSFILIITYLTSIGIVNAVKFEFHTATLSVLPLSLVFYAWIFQKWRLYTFALLFGLIVKEDVSLIIAGLGIYQLFGGQRKVGVITVVSSLSYFFIAKFLIMPFIWRGADQGYIVQSLLPLTSPIDLILILVTKPSIFIDIFFNSSLKQQTFNYIYQPVGYLALLSPLNWLTAFPQLYLRYSATGSHFWNYIFHYNANLMPSVVVSTVLVINRWHLPAKPIAILLAILLFFSGLSPNSIVWESARPRSFPNTSIRTDTLKNIPADESVSAQSALVPHLANRTKIYMYPEILDANYIVFDTSLDTYPVDNKSIKTKIDELNKSKYWTKVAGNETLVIFERINKIRY